ncbi:MAG: DUF4446 family protein [Bacillota bacterium]|nr:DUF4446 family protein [Bacillota bacterium]MDW7677964.1 DUF4446 family protein [Bacillota bacterium]
MNPWFIMLEQHTGVWLAAAIGAIMLLLLGLVVLWINLLSFKRKFKQLMRGADGANIEKQLQEHMAELKTYRESAESNRIQMTILEENLKHCVQYVGIKRYNAFEDMGSRLSYSIALLDGQLDGVVMTGIYGRQESTTYAKGIRRGLSEQHLSVEEMDALQMAKEQQMKREKK